MGSAASSAGKKYRQSFLGKTELLSPAGDGEVSEVDLQGILSRIPLFQRLCAEKHRQLAQCLERQVFQAGEVLMMQGGTAKEFYLVVSGEANVVVVTDEGEKQTMATIGPGAYLGEKALLHDMPILATVTAVSEMVVYRLLQSDFGKLSLLAEMPAMKRKAIGAGAKTLEVKPPSPKSPEEREFIGQALRNNANLAKVITLTDDQVEKMIDVCWRQEVPLGAIVIEEGDPEADYFYVVQSGTFAVHKRFAKEEWKDREAGAVVVRNSMRQSLSLGPVVNRHVGELGPGGSFGELALLCLMPRGATVVAMEDCMLWVFDRTSFKKILMQVSAGQVDTYVEYISSIEMLHPLEAALKRTIAESLVEVHYDIGQCLMQQGQVGNSVCILMKGDVTVVKDGQDVASLSADPEHKKFHVIGEKALLEDEPRNATIKAASHVRVLALDRDTFDMAVGPLSELLKGGKPAEDGAADEHFRRRSKNSDSIKSRAGKIKLRDLTKIGILGYGGFGCVELYEGATGQLFALKGCSKGFVVKQGMQTAIVNEKSILFQCQSPFIVAIYETYNSPQTLFFLMEAALGGELMTVYHRQGFHGSEAHARYYCAGVTCALEHLHGMKIIYRDLKPENILLNEKGRLKLTDMGLAKVLTGKTHTMCGTPDFFAPEMVKSTGYTLAVDWWALGVVVYELIMGYTPFEAETPIEMYALIKRGIKTSEMPNRMKKPLKDFIGSLLKVDPLQRLPMKAGGTENLRKTKWYSAFDWESFQSGAMEPPYIPEATGKESVKNFHADPSEMPEQLEYHDDGSGWDADFATDT
eukprot:TRINITY_DN4807_c0_g1_i1.p1 TRINITY_DN4807_c0_g1~~TRINITY_DN4807_c0_g1_i1.p1  ORF type:complete len:808 (-),score=222.94 TRINITY_DN4807_c0_g1_i1:252-2675(-)